MKNYSNNLFVLIKPIALSKSTLSFFAYLFFVLPFFTSCTINRKGMVSAPVNIQVNLTMDDLEYVGEVTGTASQNYFLGLPFGGRKYYRGQTASGLIGLPFVLPHLRREVANATYDALMQKPDADFVLPFSAEEKRSILFLGSKRTVTVKGKAFKIKSKA